MVTRPIRNASGIVVEQIMDGRWNAFYFGFNGDPFVGAMDTKSRAVDTARQMANTPTSGESTKAGVVVYDTDGNKSDRIVASKAVKFWLRVKSPRDP